MGIAGKLDKCQMFSLYFSILSRDEKVFVYCIEIRYFQGTIVLADVENTSEMSSLESHQTSLKCGILEMNDRHIINRAKTPRHKIRVIRHGDHRLLHT